MLMNYRKLHEYYEKLDNHIMQLQKLILPQRYAWIKSHTHVLLHIHVVTHSLLTTKFHIDVKVEISFATFLMILYILTSLQFRFAYVSLYFLLVLCWSLLNEMYSNCLCGACWLAICYVFSWGHVLNFLYLIIKRQYKFCPL